MREEKNGGIIPGRTPEQGFYSGARKAGGSVRKLRPRILRYLVIISTVTMALILLGMNLLEVFAQRNRTVANAGEIFSQVRQILRQNEENLASIMKEYKTLCLAHARTIAYILEKQPGIIINREVEELRKVGAMVGVDEIHIFNPDGVIVFGSQPQYFGLTMDSGEQIGFFKPMLTDRTLQLVQEAQPNTAEGKPVQYSAVWTENGEFIVEIGMHPDAVLKAGEKNELSYIFSLLKANAGIDLYAVDLEDGTILGCTNAAFTGRNGTEIGLPALTALPLDRGFETLINGVRSFAVFTLEGDKLLGYATPVSYMFGDLVHTCLLFGIGLLLVALLLVLLVSRLVQSFVIDDIYRINERLTLITDGKLDTAVDIRSSEEFSELSRHINDMVNSLVESRKQIERDRDMDLLTNMYNRRGLDNELLRLQRDGTALRHYAVIMVDADCLKTINDRYGHENGDLYLCRIAETLRRVGTRESICSRQGGDEFVLFLYGYETAEVLGNTLEGLCRLQSGRMIELRDGVKVEMQFSAGWSCGEGPMDYPAMLKEADARMYENKRCRHCRMENGGAGAAETDQPGHAGKPGQRKKTGQTKNEGGSST